jgi:hypothetical protein
VARRYAQCGAELKKFFSWFALILAGSALCFGRTPAVTDFLRNQMQLSQSQIAEIQNGKAVAKILPTPNPSDIFVFGTVFIHAEPLAYVHLMRDIPRLRKLGGYLGAGEFSTPPMIGDMKELSLDQSEIEDVKNCRPRNCELQLPEEFMETARTSVNWNSRDVNEQLNDLARRKIIQLLDDYRRGGDEALGIYLDKRDPLPVAEQFRSLLSHVEFFPQYLPELNRYLLEFPKSKPEATQDFFYWEKVTFGLKPTIRINHGIVYRAADLPDEVFVLAIKQLYATHYFQTALDVSFCIQSSRTSAPDGFYLITIKASRQAGLTGLKGGALRKVVVRKTRSSLESALNSIRQNLENSTDTVSARDSR